MSIDHDFQLVRDKLVKLVENANASADPEAWGEGVTVSIACRRPQPYSAVQLAERRNLASIRGVGRHHIMAEFEDCIPTQEWLDNEALPALNFLQEVSAKAPQLAIDRNAN
jgi:hypothetical protein